MRESVNQDGVIRNVESFAGQPVLSLLEHAGGQQSFDRDPPSKHDQ
jgi:hypothetical protein